MENEKTLKDYNIQNRSMLKMMIKNVQFDAIKDEEDEIDDVVEEDDEEPNIELKPFSPQRIQPSTDQNIPTPPEPSKVESESAELSEEHPLKPPPKQSDKKSDDKSDDRDAIVAGFGDVKPLSPNHKTVESVKGFNGWNVGDVCYRKGRKCVIKSIDHGTHPPSLTVALFGTKIEINTEFHLITKAPPPPPPKPQKLPLNPPNIPSNPIPKHLNPPPPNPMRSPTKHQNGKAMVPPPLPNGKAIVPRAPPTPVKKRAKPKKVHLFNPSIINQLMNVNNIKHIGGGLKNLGNSCFMNATLQCLAYTQVFQNYIYQQIHTKMC